MKIGLLGTLLVTLFSASSLAQLDRGAIAGTVSDSSGAVVPGARVSIRNSATGATYRTGSTGTGQYNMPNLPVGSYAVAFEAEGFRRLERSGVAVSVAEVVRVDATLEPGSISETISVTAEGPRLQTNTPDVGTDLSVKQLVDLPLAIDGARRAEDFAYRIAPGVSGSSNAGYIVGSTAYAKETLLDGATVSTNRAGHFGESSISVEAIQQFKVQTSGLSAEYGRTQAGVFNFVMKSGANELHGTSYGMLRNEAFNANTFANNARGEKRAMDRKLNYAGSIGGPVFLPGVYNGRNRTFFYTTYEHYRERQFPFGSPNRTVPLPEFYDGDLSRLLGPVTNFRDALDRPVLRGAIYDPATFRQLPNGRWVGEMFPGNRMPANRISRVSRNLNEIAKKRYLPTVRDASGQFALVNNALYPQAQNPQVDQYQFSVKGDQNVNDYHKLSGSYSYTLRSRMNTAPQSRSGMWDRADPRGGPLGVSILQDIKTQYARFNYNWTASPAVVNQFIASLNRFANDGSNVQSSVDGAKALGIQGLASEGYPSINWGGGPFVSLAVPGYSQIYYNAYNTWGLADTISLSRGKHFLKAGVDYRRNQMNQRGFSQPAFNFNARATAIPNETFSGNFTGYSFASYLLGIVDSASLNDPLGVGYRYNYLGLFVQDDFKVTSRFTLLLGLRWEYTSPITEVAGRLSSWSPTRIDPVSGLPGAYEFAGNCAQCTGQSFFGQRDLGNFGPRAGFAWQVHPRWTVRSAYGIVYDGIGNFTTYLGARSWVAWAGKYALDADPVTPWAGVFNWDARFPAAGRFIPPDYDPSFGNLSQPGMFDDNYGTAPYTQRWNFNIQREFGKDLIVDIGYLGGKGTGLRSGLLKRVNQLSPAYLSQYGRNLNNAVRSPAGAARNGIAYPYPGFQGTVASALRTHPQVFGNQTVLNSGSPLGFSTYHGLQVIADKRFSDGLNVYANYTWSKSISNMNSAIESDEGSRPLDYYNLKLEKAVAESDIPHMVKAFVAYELPFGKGKRFASSGRIANLLAGGWTMSVILNYFSGTPLGFGGSTPLSGGWNGAGRRINILPGEMKASGFSRSSFELSAPSSGVNTYLNKSLYSDIQPLTLGTSAYRYSQVRDFGVIKEDLGIQKIQRIGEKYRFQLRAELLNVLNRHQLSGIQTGITSPLFGQVTGVGGYRIVQLGARLDF